MGESSHTGADSLLCDCYIEIDNHTTKATVLVLVLLFFDGEK